jgi:predicted RNA polymerase sigma factor
VDAAGNPVLLLDQNRAQWDRTLIQNGLGALDHADRLTDDPGPYHLQAAIAACHARARQAADTEWARIVSLYDQLLALNPSPIVALNRAVAVGMALGPAAGLAAVDPLVNEGSLKTYHLLPSVRGDFLAKLGRHEEARSEFARAASLTQNARERELLLSRGRENQNIASR